MNAQVEKKIIIKKTIDENGVETIEKTVIEGDKVTVTTGDDVKEEINISDEINVDVDITEDGTHKKVIKIIKNGEVEEIVIDGDSENIIINGEESNDKNINIFKFEGDSEGFEDLPDDIKEKIKEVMPEGDFSEGDKKMKVIIDSKEVEISELDGEEDIFIIENVEDLDKAFEWNTEDNQRIIIKTLGDDEEDKAFLGVWPGEDTENGVQLGGVVEESAAEKAGLQEGDVITSMNGQSVNSFQDLIQVMNGTAIGDEMKIEYTRDGQNLETNATLGKNKGKKRMVYHFDSNQDFNFVDMESCCNDKKMVEKPYIGIMITNHDEGIEIDEVNREGLDLEQGDIIVEFEKQKMRDMDQLIDAIAEHQPGDLVKVKYVRDGKTKKTKVKLLGKEVKSCCCPKEKQKEIRQEIIIIQGSNGQEQIIEEDKIIQSDMGALRLNVQELDLFPNPTNGSFSVRFTLENQSPVTLSITDANGREIMKDELMDFSGTYEGVFNLKENPTGIYFLNILQNDKIYTEKIILNK